MKWLYLLLIDIFYLIRHGSVKKAAKCIRQKMLRKVWLSSLKILKYSPSNSKLTRVFYKTDCHIEGRQFLPLKTPKEILWMTLMRKKSEHKQTLGLIHVLTPFPRRFIAVCMNHEFLFPLAENKHGNALNKRRRCLVVTWAAIMGPCALSFTILL